MRAITIMAASLACTLSGCGVSLSSTVPPAPKDAAQTVYEMKTALVAAEDALLVYEQTVCPAGAACTDPSAIAINKAMASADALVSAAEVAVKANANSTSAITDAQAAIQTLQAMVSQYAPAKG